MPTFSQLPSGKWRVQVRLSGIYRGATFASKREARDWAAGIESQAHHVAAGGFAPIPKGATLADLIDKYGAKGARTEISAIKVAAPRVALDVIDRAIQVHGGAGVTDVTPLAAMYAWHRAMRLFDGPDEVHLRSIARAELRSQPLVPVR